MCAFVTHALPVTMKTSSRTVLKCSAKKCEACGQELISGCDGNGRVIGGLGAVVGWWPIKAYRPCGNFIKARGQYKRKGQSLDEIAFGRKSSGDEKSLEQRLRGE